MGNRWHTACLIGAVLVPGFLLDSGASACCPAPPSGKPVVNADQTVILLWDAANRTQHFIRKASFKSEADDFGFIVPSPTLPELNESGDEAFPYLLDLTKPEVKTVWQPPSIGCALHSPQSLGHAGGVDAETVTILQEKEVAGFNAVVLEASSSGALVVWLQEHGYAFSPEVAAWAAPYVERGWKFTALKIAKKPASSGKVVAASALRISFQTDRPLFPYREPDPKASAEALNVTHRLLRIYFVAEARYRGELTPESPWTGHVAWAGKLSSKARMELLALLKLPANTGPATAWLTEFEDNWPYQAAPADVYFSRDKNQDNVRREPIIQYSSSGWPRDFSLYALAAVVVFPPLVRRRRRNKKGLNLGS
jgi:Uncharacterized protein conserved in bacteria (DUF2330)